MFLPFHLLEISVYLILSQPVHLGIVEETHLEVTLEVECKREVRMSELVLIKTKIELRPLGLSRN